MVDEPLTLGSLRCFHRDVLALAVRAELEALGDRVTALQEQIRVLERRPGD